MSNLILPPFPTVYTGGVIDKEAAFNAAVEALSPVLYMPLGGTSLTTNTVGTDATNNGVIATSGPDWASDGASGYDGSSWLEVPTYAAINNLTAGALWITTNAWIYWPTAGSGTGGVVMAKGPTGTIGSWYGWYSYVSSTNYYTFTNGNGQYALRFRTTNTIPFDTWIMVTTVSWNNSSGNQMYINGQPVGTTLDQAPGGASGGDSAYDFRVGARWNQQSLTEDVFYYNGGKIKGVGVFDYELTSTQIADMYAAAA